MVILKVDFSGIFDTFGSLTFETYLESKSFLSVVQVGRYSKLILFPISFTVSFSQLTNTYYYKSL